MFERPLVLDIFSGAGGMSLGFEQAGFDVIAAVEIDPIHCATHKFNFPLCKVFCKSVENVFASEIIEKGNLKEKKLDVLIGGSPCQGFSTIGKRSLDDPRNYLIKHFIRLAIELQPKYFVLENVRGITIGDHRKFLEDAIASFRNCGYKTLPHQILNAANYGVPQNRERLFLIGYRQDMKPPKYPAPTHCLPGKLSLFPNCATVREAISDLPDVEQFIELFETDAIYNFSEKQKSQYVMNLDSGFGYYRNYDPKLLTSSMRTKHQEIARERFAETPQGKKEPISRFYKLDPQGICNTLRAGTNSDRGSHTAARPIHPFYPRCITVREAARLHSYPDWFRFHITKWHGFRQVGNSVPPMLAKAIASEILKALGDCPKKPEQILDLGDPRLLQLTFQQAQNYFRLLEKKEEEKTASVFA